MWVSRLPPPKSTIDAAKYIVQWNSGDKNMNAVVPLYVNVSLSLLNEVPSPGTIFFQYANPATSSLPPENG
jgi:hypothetical protein